MTVLEQRFMERVPNLLGDIAKSLGTIAKAKPKQTVWVVTYVGLSDSEYEANGYCECHVCGTLEAAKAKMRQLRDAEIENCKAEGRDYEILEDETTELRISWCSHGEQVRLEIHEEEVK